MSSERLGRLALAGGLWLQLIGAAIPPNLAVVGAPQAWALGATGRGV
ncbi:MAG: hypothetical protein JNK29_03805, partial [Anaerolineales bacterium]|nr:hypothetical protein [Anaerolineales bacterium]